MINVVCARVRSGAKRRADAAQPETGINDARVAPHNAAKMAARLQAADARNVALLRVALDGGHNSNDLSKEQADAEYADEFAFVLAAARGKFGSHGELKG